MSRLAFVLAALPAVVSGCADPVAGASGSLVRPATPDEVARFERHWQDGRAEVSGYRLSVVRYGATRVGQAAMIVVTEPFRVSARVKADDPSRRPSDVADALKMNLTRDFQTGVYDYNTMTSLFVLARSAAPSKLTFTSAEWCGQVYEELRFGADAVEQEVRSYFEGESTDAPIAGRDGGVAEDALFVLARDLRGELLAPGERREVALLPSAFFARLTHRANAWTEATLSRAADPAEVETPAGTFSCDVYEVRAADGRAGRLEIEREWPRRLVRWTFGENGALAGEGAERGELLGTRRLKYWEMQDDAGTQALQALGLSPIAPGG